MPLWHVVLTVFIREYALQLLAFTPAEIDLSAAFHAHHTPSLVWLSILIAILAAFTSFNHVELIRKQERRKSSMLWLALGAVAMGSGVWAMHFIGMLSYSLPVPVTYHSGITLLSVLPAIMAGFVTLQVMSSGEFTWRRVLLGGVLMGAGIGVMHYLGMAAMVLPADRLYRPGLFLASIVVAVVLATLALGVRPLLQNFLRQRLALNLASSVLMGLAISSMHYVAMHATVFMPLQNGYNAYQGHVLDSQALVTIAVAAAVFIVLISMVVVAMRYRLLGAEQEQQAAIAEARQIEARFYSIAERVPGVVYEFTLSPQGQMHIPYISEAVKDVYGVSAEQVIADAELLMACVHPKDVNNVLEAMNQSASTLEPWQLEFRIVRHGSEQVRWVLGNATPTREADGAVTWSGVITDITEQKRHEQTVHQLAFYDALTELPNRRMTLSLLTDHMQQAERSGQFGAVLFIDLDNFKRLNDTQGHSAGDELLRQVGQRLLRLAPKSSVVGRQSSDEFVLVLGQQGASSDAAHKSTGMHAERILHALSQPYDLHGNDYACALSIGACVFQQQSFDAAELLKRADIAMHVSKRSGGNKWRIFDPAMQAQLQRRYEIEQAMPTALACDEFELHFQPKVMQPKVMQPESMQPEGAGQVIYGAEALIRWRHPDFGMVSPADFIPLAESNGFIVPLGTWVLRTACQTLQQWQQDEHLKGLQLAVNVSPRQFYQPDFVHRVEQLLQKYPEAAQQLTIELTESLVLEDIEEAIRRMAALGQLGVRLSLDDFGTGFSSLSYLSQMAFDEVKIDQHFVRAMSSSESGRELIIIEAIVQLADKLDMDVIAEGVESDAERVALLSKGCFAFQGYYFSKPLPKQDFVSFVATHSGA